MMSRAIQKELEDLRYAVESATVEREIAEEKLEATQRELEEALLKIETLEANSSAERTTILEQAISKLRDVLAEKVREMEENEAKHAEQLKALEEQVDASQSAQEMVETLTQQKVTLEDKCKKLQEEVDFMEEKCLLSEEMLETALSENKNLLLDVDRLNVQISEMVNKQRDMADYLVSKEQDVCRLEELNRKLHQEKDELKGQCYETQSIEQQKHQIENVAYKLNFSESKMAEKEAELARCKRNLSSMEEQMKSLSDMTKAQSTKIDELKVQIETKVGEIEELKQTLQDKIEKNGEMEIRKDLAEKKLLTVQANLEAAESKVTALKLRLERKEIEYDEIFRRQDIDINELTAQRDELKERLSNMSVNWNQRPTTRQNIMSLEERTQEQTLPSIASVRSASEHVASIQQSSLASDSLTVGDTNSLIEKINGWKRAFDLVSRQNMDLKMKLASIELCGKSPPLAFTRNKASRLSSNPLKPDIRQLEALKDEVEKFKNQVRQSILEQTIFTRERPIRFQVHNYEFKNAQMAKKFRALENDLTRLSSKATLSTA